ncbi:MAG: peptidylprolyl isomerase [Candidatus Atribacteria bacterium]|nr:peptidylprolyl isomerase [Candidatus Atribacteria bacterium]
MTNMKHKKLFLALLIAILVFFLIAISGIAAQDTPSNETEAAAETVVFPPETIVASFGSFTITLEDLNSTWDTVPAEYKAQLTKSSILDQMISEKLLIQDAKSKDLISDKEIAKQIDDMTNQILIQGLIQKEVLETAKVTDEEAIEYYNNNQAEFTEKEQVHLFNILVETEEEANSVLEELNSGKDFSEVAKEKSTGPSADQGGDLGYITRGSIIPEIEEVVFTLEIDSITDVIKSDYGFHILKISEKKPEELKSFDDVRESIIQNLLPEKQKSTFDNLIEELKSKTEIEINEETLR